MVLLYGRAGRLNTNNAGFRPGQKQRRNVGYKHGVVKGDGRTPRHVSPKSTHGPPAAAAHAADELVVTFHEAVRARPGRLSTLRVSHSKSGSVWRVCMGAQGA
jgi:hypothetical protein